MFWWNTWIRWCLRVSIDVRQPPMEIEDSRYLQLRVVSPFLPFRFILDYKNFYAKWLMFSWNNWVRWCLRESINVRQSPIEVQDSRYLRLRVVSPFPPFRFILDYKNFYAKWLMFWWNTWVRWCLRESIDVCQPPIEVEDSRYLRLRVVSPFLHFRFILDYKNFEAKLLMFSSKHMS